MEFLLTDEQKMFQENIRKFVEKEVLPGAKQRDDDHAFPWEIVKQLAEMGCLGITIPEEYDGTGLPEVNNIILIEELSKADAALGVIVSVHNTLATYPLKHHSSEDLKRKYLPILASGKKIGCYSLSEPGAGSNPAQMVATATLRDGYYYLNGQKTWVTNGKAAEICIIFAKTDPSAGGRGISCFVVEKGTPGLDVGKVEDKMGMNSSDTVEFFLTDCKVPKENLIGTEGVGLKIALAVLNDSRIGIGAQALGIAQGALNCSIKYAKERVQFGKPIAEFQAIQWKLANMATKIDAARALVYRAAMMKDLNIEHIKEASMAKLLASEVATEVAQQAVQIFGGYGYTEDYPVERYFRESKLTEIYEGTSEMQRILIARQLLKN